VQAVVWRSAASTIIAFRGTVTPDGASSANVALDAAAAMRPLKLPAAALPSALVHAGFQDGAAALLPPLLELLGDEAVHCTGHSLGGAMATLVALALAANRTVSCTTFGCPRVGDAALAAACDAAVPDTLRVVNAADVVPMVPLADRRPYVHCGRLLHIGLRGNVLLPLKLLDVAAFAEEVLRHPPCVAQHAEPSYFGTLRAALTVGSLRFSSMPSASSPLREYVFPNSLSAGARTASAPQP